MKKIKLYSINTEALADQNVFDVHMTRVSEYRRQKVDRMRFQSDKCLSLGAGLLLERAMDDLGFTGEAREIGFSEKGKPFLLNNKNINFSISHSGVWAILAISDDNIELGCDIEKLTQPEKYEKIKSRVLAEAELEYLDAICDYDKKNRSFGLFWTLKESYAKAVGIGMGMDFRKIVSDLNSLDAEKIAVSSELSDEKYYVSTVWIDDSYTCCVCCNCDDFVVETKLY